jgi:hypothetical protein
MPIKLKTSFYFLDMSTFTPKAVAGTGAGINSLRKFNGIHISFTALYTPRVFTGSARYLTWLVDHIF